MRFIAARAAYADSFGCPGIRAQNGPGRSHRMCCTLHTDTCSSGDAQIAPARTAFKSSESGSLSGWFDASQIRSQQTHGLYDATIVTMQFPLRFTQRPCLDLRFQAPIIAVLLCPFGSSAPLHFEHLCSGHAKLLEFRWSELPHALHRFGLHSRAEWPVSPHVLPVHTRYGHEPIFWPCPDCVRNVQYVLQP